MALWTLRVRNNWMPIGVMDPTCTHTEYSLGAIYLTFMHLPRIMRFRQENVLLILGSKEPKTDIKFLSPSCALTTKVLCRCRNAYSISVLKCASLLCSTICCLRASRKVCGFLGHSANLGCSKCMKRFPGQIGQKY